MDTELEGYISVREAADRYQVAYNTVIRWYRNNWAEGKEVYGRLFMKEDTLDAANERSRIVSGKRKK